MLTLAINSPMCRHIFPGMEAASRVGYLFALRAVWNFNLTDFPGADARLSFAVRGDECHFPLDARAAPGTVHMLVRVFNA